MATIYVGSARQDEDGNLSGGVAGDQTGAEVMTQAMYTHSKGWYILRPSSVTVADALAAAMLEACANSNIGYDQGNRGGVITQLKRYGSLAAIKTATECDCSSLVRACCIQAGFDPGNFTTSTEASVLAATGKFEARAAYVSQVKTPVYNGDVLVTKTKGHTVIVVSGSPRASSTTTTTTTEEGYDVAKLSTIKSGSSGAQVKSLQMLLNGKNSAGLTVDGQCGTKTVSAIKRYQTAKGLDADGICGPLTWAKILTT